MQRVLVIGLDGATLDLVEPWAAAGRLPTLSALMHQGRYAVLRSVIPVISAAAWTSLVTGVNPGKHGIFDFMRRAPDGYQLRPVHRGHVRAPSLWRLLSDCGRRVVVINVPMTFPPEPVNGVLVSGLGTPDHAPFTHPVALGAELRRSGYRVNKRERYRPGAEDSFLAEVTRTTRCLAEQSETLLRQQAWDLAMVVFRDTDEITHFFWQHMDAKHPGHAQANPAYRNAIADYYQLVDQLVGQLVQAAGTDTTVLVVSDHGAGPLLRDVYLNEWLRQEGFLALRAARDASRAQAILARLGITRDGISRTLRRAHLGRLERWLKDRLGHRIEVLPRSGRTEFPDAIDWANTRAYSFGNQGQIYVNLVGREPRGTVPVSEYEATLSELESRLSRLVDPEDGQPVVSRLVRQAEAFSGPYAASGPDLIVFMRDLAYVTRQRYEFGDRAGQIFGPPSTHESGWHRLEGLIIASGPGISPGPGRVDPVSILDVTPTVLSLQGCPLPGYLDGRVLLDWLSAPLPPAPSDARLAEMPAPPDAEATLSEAEEEEIADRLRGLGYLT